MATRTTVAHALRTGHQALFDVASFDEANSLYYLFQCGWSVKQIARDRPQEVIGEDDSIFMRHNPHDMSMIKAMIHER